VILIPAACRAVLLTARGFPDASTRPGRAAWVVNRPEIPGTLSGGLTVAAQDHTAQQSSREGPRPMKHLLHLTGPARPGHCPGQNARAGCAFRKSARDMMAWAGTRLWLAVRTVIRAVKMACDEQVYMWECVLLTSGAAPLTAAGPLRWVPSLGGYRLVGSHLPAQDPSDTGR